MDEEFYLCPSCQVPCEKCNCGYMEEYWPEEEDYLCEYCHGTGVYWDGPGCEFCDDMGYKWWL